MKEKLGYAQRMIAMNQKYSKLKHFNSVGRVLNPTKLR